MWPYQPEFASPRRPGWPSTSVWKRSIERSKFSSHCIEHTAAYWLMLAVREAIPKARDLASIEFATRRLRLIKIAARVIDTASRVRLAFAACWGHDKLSAI
jgi:hypothetical protein